MGFSDACRLTFGFPCLSWSPKMSQRLQEPGSEKSATWRQRQICYNLSKTTLENSN